MGMPVLVYGHSLQLTYNYAIFVIMKNTRHNKYRIVDDLPKNAMRVSEYAAQWERANGGTGCNTSYIYELVANNKNTNFEIVVYKGINFVLINK